MKLTATIIFIFTLTIISAQEIVAVISSTATGDNQGKSVYISDTRSAYSAGEFNGEFTLGSHTVISNSHQTLFFTKLNSQGSHEWLNTIKGTRDVFASTILVEENLLYLGGSFSDSVFVGSDTLLNYGQIGSFIAVFDTLGVFQYSLNLDCETCVISDFIVKDNNELIATGKYFDEFNFAGQNYDSPLGNNFFIVNFDLQNKEEIWFQGSTGSNTLANRVNVDSNGDILIVGSYGQGVTIGTTPMFDNGSEHNTFVAKYSATGNFLWVEGIIGLSQIHGLGLEIGDNDDIFICAEFELTVSVPDGSTLNTEGLMDGLVYKFSSNGDYQWAQQIGGIDDDPAIDMVLDLNGNPLILLNSGRNTSVASTTLDPNGFNEPLLVKLNKFDGSYIWHQRIPSLSQSGVVLSKSIAIQDSIICITGANYSGIEFNNNVIVSNNLHDYFLALLFDHDYAEHASLKDLSAINTFVYPNPFTTSFNITSDNKLKIMKIYALDGTLVFSSNIHENQITIYPNLIPGTYLLNIETENTITTTKITQL